VPVNLDFTHNAGFSWYVVLLLISGAVMLAMAAMPRTGQRVGARILNLVVSLGFLGYGIYLAFFFQGGTYFVFFKVFIVPVLLLVNFVRTLARRRSARPAASGAPAMPQPGPGVMPPPGYGVTLQPGPGAMPQYPPAPMQQYAGQEGTAAPGLPPES
jgi:hypothetical protein